MYNRQCFENESNNDKIIGNYCIHYYDQYDNDDEPFDDNYYDDSIGFIAKFNRSNIVAIIHKNHHITKSYL